MKKRAILCLLLIAVLSRAFPKVLASLPDLGKPTWLRVDSGYVFVSDHYSVFVYELKTLKLVTVLGKKGEGPKEFKMDPRIAVSDREIFLYSNDKVIRYSKDFTYREEVRANFSIDRLETLEKGFVITTSQVNAPKRYLDFRRYDTKLEKRLDLVKIQEDLTDYNFMVFSYPVCRTWKDKIFIAQRDKGFRIEVFDKNGKKLYQIEKKVEKIKAEEKHRQLDMDFILYFLGKSRFERAKRRGVFDKPMHEFMPDINSFWVKDDKIYVKTYDITDKTERFIVLDLKGNQLKTVFLPITYRETLAFDNNVFYYLEDSEEADAWVLHGVEL